MRIVFTGDSYTWGSELKDNYSSRYSRHMCISMGAEEVNLGVGGSSNDAIALRLVEYLHKNSADYVIIQLTDTHRVNIAHPTEEEFKSLNHLSGNNNLKGRMPDIRQKVAKYIFDLGKKNTRSWYRMSRYKLLLLDNYLNSKDIKYILCTKSDELNEFLNDPELSDNIKEKFLTPSLAILTYGNRTQGPSKGHPNEKGHEIIAVALEKKLKDLYF